jgi:hypothetical protein
LSAELLATGSPRKRFDKAVKAAPKVIAPMGFHGGRAVLGSIKSFENEALARRILAIIGD